MVDARQPDAGVTLIEMLVVLSLIAVGAGIVTLALPDRASERSVAQEADLLVSRLNLAAERSVIEGRTFRLSWSAEGYGFSTWSSDAWQESDTGLMPAKHLLSEGATLADNIGVQPKEILISPDLVPPREGALEWRVLGGASDVVLRFDGLRATAGSGP